MKDTTMAEVITLLLLKLRISMLAVQCWQCQPGTARIEKKEYYL